MHPFPPVVDFVGAAETRPLRLSRRTSTMPDLAYVLITVAAFVVMGLLVKGVERL